MPLSASNARKKKIFATHTARSHNAPAMKSGNNEGSHLFPLWERTGLPTLRLLMPLSFGQGTTRLERFENISLKKDSKLPN
jgi:hypothetical protein